MLIFDEHKWMGEHSLIYKMLLKKPDDSSGA